MSSSPPGYDFYGLFALANLTGTSAPRTNVARSDLEQTSELKSTFASVYRAVAKHIEQEFQRIRDDGRGTTTAAIEADLLTEQLLSGAKSPEDATTCIKSLRILLLEDESGRRLVSRNDLAALVAVYTAEGPLLDHIDGICESVEVKHSSNEIIKQLTGGEEITIPYPRLIGKRLNALDGFEVESILVDFESISLNLKWTTQQDRWHQVTEEEARKMEEMEFARASHFLGWHIATGDVKCNSSTISVVRFRRLTFFLPNCPVTELWQIYHGDPRCLVWCMYMIHEGRIAENDIPRLRMELTELGADADDVIPRMVIPADMIFNVRSYIRTWDWEKG